MKLLCYPTSNREPRIVSAPLERDWMDATSNAFGYRCLPLNIANAHGWFILNDAPFVAQWNGDDDLDAVQIETIEAEGVQSCASSHFGHGILTFHVDCLFRTEPGYDLWVTGPSNMPKDGIQALTGVVEADWSPFTFTMNWRFTRKQTPIAFEHREPICMIFPVPRSLMDSVQPEFRSLESDPDLNAKFNKWSSARAKFNSDLKVSGSQAERDKWQKEYFRGRTEDLTAPADHRAKLRPPPFTWPRQ